MRSTPSRLLALFAAAMALVAVCTLPRTSSTAHADTSGGTGAFVLRVRTCTAAQNAAGDTNDTVWATFQVESTAAGGAPKAWALKLDNPGDDREFGLDEYRFSWPASMGPVSSLSGLTLTKAGTDNWCVSEVSLSWNDALLTRWTSANSQASGSYYPAHPTSGVVVLNDAPGIPFFRLGIGTARAATYTMQRAAVPNDFRTYLLEVDTCTTQQGGTSDDVHVEVHHDGLVDVVIVPGATLTPGQWKKALDFSQLGYVDDLTRIRFVRPAGTDELCVDDVRIRAGASAVWPNQSHAAVPSPPGNAADPTWGVVRNGYAGTLSYAVAWSSNLCLCLQSIGGDPCNGGCLARKPAFETLLNTTNASCAAGQAPGSTTDTSCDGQDQNCSGIPDEGWAPGVGLAPNGCRGECWRTRATCVAGIVVCGAPTLEIGSNGRDDDCNGTADDAVSEVSCSDNVSNDNDGLVDCDDRSECKDSPSCVGKPCAEDYDCAFGLTCTETGDCRKPHCSNGILDQDEVQKDCGGTDCRPCDPLLECPARCRPGEETTPTPLAVLALRSGAFTRASTATFDFRGQLSKSDANELRWMPVADRRLALFEGAGQNLVPWSENFADTSWRTAGATRSPAVNATTAPDGTVTAERLIANVESARSRALGVSLPAASSYTFSTWVRSTTPTRTRTWLLQGAAAGDLPATFAATRSAVWDLDDTWQRLSVSDARATGAWVAFSEAPGWPTTGVRPMDSDSFFAWGAQLEAFPFPTSYIPTTGAARSRAADVLTFAAGTQPPWLRTGMWQVDVAPQFDSDQALTTPMVLLAFGTTEVAFIREADKTFLRIASGATVLHKREIGFSRNDLLSLTFTTSTTPAARRVTVLGAVLGSGAQDAPALVFPAGDLRVGGRLSGGFEAYAAISDLRQVTAPTGTCSARPECLCGNGTVDAGEQCDPAASPFCDASCRSTGTTPGACPCPIGQHCEFGAGDIYGGPATDACVPDICNTRRAEFCGTVTSVCGECACVPDCSQATCGATNYDGCGGICNAICDVGMFCEPGDCKEGLTCGLGNGPSFDKGEGTSVCWDEACERPNPPPDANCGPSRCVPQCQDKACGSDGCGGVCGVCTRDERGNPLVCNQDFQCAPPQAPDDPGSEATASLDETVGLGTLPGSFDVGDTGQATYRIPVELPPTRGALMPNLAFEYDSSRGNGYMGSGWTVSSPVLSIIARCATDALSPVGAKNVELGPNDEYCLDGQLLVRTEQAGSLPAILRGRGVSDADVDLVRTYRTRFDTHALIFGIDRSASASPSDVPGKFDPDEWYVITANAELRAYGEDPSTKLATALPWNSTLVFHTWALGRITNLSSDSLFVSYACKEEKDKRCVDREQSLVPTTITYGCRTENLETCRSTHRDNEDAWAVREVVFDYDREPRTDKLDGFRHGSYLVRRSRLKALFVTGYYTPGTSLDDALAAEHGNRERHRKTLRTYQLTYGGVDEILGEKIALAEPSRLFSIQLCASSVPGDTLASDDATGCLKRTTFSYAIERQRSPAQIGYPEAEQAPVVHKVDATLSLDFDGNGTTDWLRWDDEGLCLVRSIPDASAAHGVRLEETCDGLFTPTVGTTLSARDARRFLRTTGVPKYLSKTSLWTWCKLERQAGPSDSDQCAHDVSADVGDLNGDRRDDLFVFDHYHNQFVLYLSSGSGFVYRTIPATSRPSADPFDWSLIDLNRDGLADALYCSQDSPEWVYRLATPSGFGPEVSLPSEFDYGSTTAAARCARQGNWARPIKVDLNGDGYPEVLANDKDWVQGPRSWNGGSSLIKGLEAVSFDLQRDGTIKPRVLVTGLTERMVEHSSKTLEPNDKPPISIDINGDGLTDFVTLEQLTVRDPEDPEPFCYQGCFYARLWRNRGVRAPADDSLGFVFEDAGLLETKVTTQDADGQELIKYARVKMPRFVREWHPKDRNHATDWYSFRNLLPSLGAFAIDYDADGRGDFVFPGHQFEPEIYRDPQAPVANTRLAVHRGFVDARDESELRFQFTEASTITSADDELGLDIDLAATLVHGDFNADGAADVQVYVPGRDPKRNKTPAREYTFFGAGSDRYLLERVEDGLGNITVVQYARGHAADVYSPGKDPAAPLYVTPHLPRHVVSQVVHRTGGLGRGFQGTKYHYTGYTIDSRTRAPLGFLERSIHEFEGAFPGGEPAFGTEIARTLLKYDHRAERIDGVDQYPYAGRVAKAYGSAPVDDHDYLSGDGYVALQRMETTWDLAYSDAGRPFVYAHEQARSHAALAGTLDSSGGPLDDVDDAHSVFEVDEHGNTTGLSVDTHDGNVFASTFGFDYSDPRLARHQLRLRTSVLEQHLVSGSVVDSRTFYSDFDDAGLVTMQSRGFFDEGSRATTFVRDPVSHNVTTIRDSATGGETTITYDDAGVFPITITNALDHETQVRVHPALGVLSSSTDPGGVERSWRYDLLGRLVRARGPEGDTTRALSAQSPRADDLGVTIDAVLKVREEAPWGGYTEVWVDSLGRTVRTERDGIGELAHVVQEMEYDSRGRLTRASRPYGSGRDGFETFRYNQDTLVGVTHADGTSESTYAVPVALLPSNLRDAVPGTAKDVSVHADARGYLSLDAYGRRGLLLRRAEELVDVDSTARRWLNTDYLYGKFDRLRRIVDPMGNPTEFETDSYGRLRSRNDPATGFTQYAYDARDLVIAETDAEGRGHSFVYDKLDRLVSRTSWDGDDATWTYDCRPEDATAGRCAPSDYGRLLRTSTSTGNTVDYAYYPTSNAEPGAFAGAVRSITRTTRVPDGLPLSMTIRSRYTSRGFVDTLSYPTLTKSGADTPTAFDVQYVYDGDGGGELLEVRDPNAATSYWKGEEVDQGQRFTLERLGNGLGLRTVFQQNNGRVSRLFAGTGLAQAGQANLLQNLAYGYDADGNVTSEGAPGSLLNTRSYRHDSLGRLRDVTVVRATGVADQVELYQYDDLGNLLRKKSPTGDVSYGYDSSAMRQLDANGAPVVGLYERYRPYLARTVGGTSFEHDFAGNETERESANGFRKLRNYNAFNLPRQVVTETDDTFDLDYDADGARVAKHDDEHDSHTYYFDGAYTLRVDASGSAHEYKLALGSRATLLVTRFEDAREDAVSYVIADRLGSASTTTDESGGFVSSAAYTAFGELRAGTAPDADKPGYTGHIHDPEFGLINMRGRLYDPASARFTTADPFVFKPWGAGLNRYSYVQNSPLRFVDPSGFEPVVLPPEVITADRCRALGECGPPVTQSQIARMDAQLGQQEARVSAMSNRTPGAPGGNGNEVLGGAPICVGTCHGAPPREGRPPNEDETRMVDGIAGTVLSFGPGLGEVQDGLVITDPLSTRLERAIATFSLSVNAAVPVLPNLGGLIRFIQGLRGLSGKGLALGVNSGARLQRWAANRGLFTYWDAFEDTLDVKELRDRLLALFESGETIHVRLDGMRGVIEQGDVVNISDIVDIGREGIGWGTVTMWEIAQVVDHHLDKATFYLNDKIVKVVWQ